MTTNPLVEAPVDTSSALGGTMLLESLYDLSRAIESEDWLAAGLAGLSTVLDTAAAVMDPLGQLIAAGLGWLMEHVEPLKGWLNDLTGDAGAVLGFAGTWDNISSQMTSAAGDLDHLVAADLEGMRGQGIEAYARYASDFAEHMRGISGSSTAVANSLRTCSTIVQVVHDLVRDALAEIVGAAISWAAQIVFTLGLGTPWVISQVATRVSSLAARVGSKVTGVIDSARALGDLIDALKAAIRSLGDNLRNARPGGGRTPSAPTPAPRAPLPDVSDLRHLMDEAYSTVPPDAAKLQEWAEQVAARHPAGLTPEEVLDIHWYTRNDGYDAMNGVSRNPAGYTDAERAAIEARMDSASNGMSRLPQHDGTTYRGTDLPAHVLTDYVPGNTVRDPAYWSTSTDPHVAQNFRGATGNAFITIDGGRSGVDVRQLSFYGNEAEILFDRGAPFEVISRDWNPAGYWDIVLRDARP